MRRFQGLIRTGLKIAITGAILWYMHHRGTLNFSRVKAVYLDLRVVVICISLISLAAVAGFYRWWLLLSGQRLHLSKMEAFQLTMIGGFFNIAIPGAVSGDL